MATSTANTTTKKANKKSAAWWWIVMVILLAVLIALAVYWWQKGTATVASGPCKASDLALSMGNSEGAAGTVYMHATLTNKGQQTCTIKGYPTVSLVDSHGVLLGANAQNNPLYGAGTVTLSPGNTAHAVVGFPDAGNFNPGICDTASSKLRFVLPGVVVSDNELVISFAQHACPGFSTTTVQPGS